MNALQKEAVMTVDLPHVGLSQANWKAGKTPASVQFVADAEKMLSIVSSPNDKEILQHAIYRVKKGRLVLEQWTDVKDYLEAARLNYSPTVRIGREEFTLDEFGQNMGEIVKVIDQPGSTTAGIINAYTHYPRD